MDNKLVSSLGNLIKKLEENKEMLLKDLIIAKVTDQEVANSLEKEIQKIEVFFEDLIQADTEQKLKTAVKKFQDSIR
ncbi:MAG: hypothetical protein CME66_08255 [Halobacteriovoraceae bacterium]|nr:hypothetical protein [Halobacteriovoraceae bacterium]|tara:strand:+ start:331 stop:561 length:231 start_codon:yes stop_codon:yes gene_type:complete